MKKYIIPALAIVALMVSCVKEAVTVDETPSNLVEIRATINNEDTKTDYDISNGEDGIFYWTGQETIRRMWFTSTPSVGLDNYVSTTTASNKETTLVFSGAFTEDQTDYAVYPSSLSFSLASGDAKSMYLRMPTSFEYNSEAPLKNIIPMIGKLNGSEGFVFYPVTGVVAVRVKNLPETARSISLSSDTKIGGWHLVSWNPGNYASNLNAIMNVGFSTGNAGYAGESSLKYTFASGLDASEHVFYFPVSVGTLTNGLVISIKDGDGNVLQTLKYGKSITTQKGQITRFPLIDLANATTKIAIDGDASQFYAYLTALRPDAASIKFAVASTSAEAITAAASSEKEVTSVGISNKVEVSDGLSKTGLYYLGYKVYDSSSAELMSGSIPVYYITSADAAKYTGTYTWTTLSAFSRNATSNWISLTGSEDSKLVIETSNDPTKGCIMITSLDGFSYTGTMTNTSIIPSGTALNPNNSPINFGGTYGAGSPQYGDFQSSTLLRFYNTAPFFSLNGTNYYLHHGAAQYSIINFELTEEETKIKLTYGSPYYGFCFAEEDKLKSSGTYAGSEVCIKFNGTAVAEKVLNQ